MSVILVVDDEELVRMTLVDILRDAGHEVCEASSAALGREVLSQRSDIKLVISDNKMRGEDGSKFLLGLKSSRPDLSLMMCTGNMPDGFEQHGIRVLNKPITCSELRRAVSELGLG